MRTKQASEHERTRKGRDEKPGSKTGRKKQKRGPQDNGGRNGDGTRTASKQ